MISGRMQGQRVDTKRDSLLIGLLRPQLVQSLDEMETCVGSRDFVVRFVISANYFYYFSFENRQIPIIKLPFFFGLLYILIQLYTSISVKEHNT